MKWINHKIVTGSLVFVLTGDLAAAMAAAAGSIVPDSVEGNPEDSSNWRHCHRRWSHWFVPYLGLAILFLLIAAMTGAIRMNLQMIGYFLVRGNLGPALTHFVGFFFFGGTMHIFEDFFCGTVPAFDPRKRIGKRLFFVGSGKEYLISFGVLVTALWVSRL